MCEKIESKRVGLPESSSNKAKKGEFKKSFEPLNSVFSGSIVVHFSSELKRSLFPR